MDPSLNYRQLLRNLTATIIGEEIWNEPVYLPVEVTGHLCVCVGVFMCVCLSELDGACIDIHTYSQYRTYARLLKRVSRCTDLICVLSVVVAREIRG